MAQAFLVRKAKQNSKGVSYCVIKHRAWVYTKKFDNESEAVKEYEKQTNK